MTGFFGPPGGHFTTDCNQPYSSDIQRHRVIALRWPGSAARMRMIGANQRRAALALGTDSGKQRLRIDLEAFGRGDCHIRGRLGSVNRVRRTEKQAAHLDIRRLRRMSENGSMRGS